MSVKDWLAGAGEHRVAACITIAGSLLVVLMMIVPAWFQPHHTPAKHKIRAHIPAYKLPHRLSRTHTTKSTDKAAIVSPSPVIHQQKNKLKHGYYVQTGAFKDATRAKKIAASLQHTNWHVQTIIKENDLHAVLIGPWQTRQRAKKAKQKLASKNKLQGFIIHQYTNNDTFVKRHHP